MPTKRPAKQQQPSKDAPTSAETSMPTVVTPTAVTVMEGSTSSSSPPPTNYVSPLKKLRKTMQQHSRRVIDTIDDLREFIENNDVNNAEIRTSIRIQARLLWTANDCIHGLRFLRVYLGEQRAPEPLQEQQKEYQEAQRDDPYQANQFLITLSLYDILVDNPNVPLPGSIIAFVPTKLRLFRGCCQVETKLHQIATVTPP